MDDENQAAKIENLRRQDDNQIGRIIDSVQAQTAEIRQMRESISEMHEVLSAWRGAKNTIKIVYWTGQIIKWTAATTAAVSVIWYAWKK